MRARATAVKGPPTLDMLRLHRAEIQRLAEVSGISNIRVYGSVVRGDARPESDIDLLVDIEVGQSALDLVAFAQDLEDLLGYRVDAGTSVHPVIRRRVEEQAVPL